MAFFTSAIDTLKVLVNRIRRGPWRMGRDQPAGRLWQR